MAVTTPSLTPIVDRDLACFNCGYNLRGLAASGVCPECSASVKTSISADAMGVTGEECRALCQVAYLLTAALACAQLGGVLLLGDAVVIGRACRIAECGLACAACIRLAALPARMIRDLVCCGLAVCASLMVLAPPLLTSTLPILGFGIWTLSMALSLVSTWLIMWRIADACGRLDASRAEAHLQFGVGLHLIISAFAVLLILTFVAAGSRRAFDVWPAPGSAFGFAAAPALLAIVLNPPDLRMISAAVALILSVILVGSGLLRCAMTLSAAAAHVTRGAAERIASSSRP